MSKVRLPNVTMPPVMFRLRSSVVVNPRISLHRKAAFVPSSQELASAVRRGGATGAAAPQAREAGAQRWITTELDVFNVAERRRRIAKAQDVHHRSRTLSPSAMPMA